MERTFGSSNPSSLGGPAVGSRDFFNIWLSFWIWVFTKKIGGFYPQNGWFISWKTLWTNGMIWVVFPLFLETPIFWCSQDQTWAWTCFTMLFSCTCWGVTSCCFTTNNKEINIWVRLLHGPRWCNPYIALGKGFMGSYTINSFTPLSTVNCHDLSRLTAQVQLQPEKVSRVTCVLYILDATGWTFRNPCYSNQSRIKKT